MLWSGQLCAVAAERKSRYAVHEELCEIELVASSIKVVAGVLVSSQRPKFLLHCFVRGVGSCRDPEPLYLPGRPLGGLSGRSCRGSLAEASLGLFDQSGGFE